MNWSSGASSTQSYQSKKKKKAELVQIQAYKIATPGVFICILD
jgi:hypothetical protein